MAFGPESPSKIDGLSGLDWGMCSRGLGARDASSCPSTAFEVDQGDVLDRTIALNFAGNTGGLIEVSTQQTMLRSRRNIALPWGSCTGPDTADSGVRR
jgi:hypothetical protein